MGSQKNGRFNGELAVFVPKTWGWLFPFQMAFHSLHGWNTWGWPILTTSSKYVGFRFWAEFKGTNCGLLVKYSEEYMRRSKKEPFCWWWFQKLQTYFQPWLQHIFRNGWFNHLGWKAPSFLAKFIATIHRRIGNSNSPQIGGDWIGKILPPHKMIRNIQV